MIKTWHVIAVLIIGLGLGFAAGLFTPKDCRVDVELNYSDASSIAKKFSMGYTMEDLTLTMIERLPLRKCLRLFLFADDDNYFRLIACPKDLSLTEIDSIKGWETFPLPYEGRIYQYNYLNVGIDIPSVESEVFLNRIIQAIES